MGSDGKISLPKDADGREIPLNTTALYDENGSRRVVDWFKFYPDNDRWVIVFKGSYSHFLPKNLSITKPDSWDKLLDDLDNAAKGGDNAESETTLNVSIRAERASKLAASAMDASCTTKITVALSAST